MKTAVLYLRVSTARQVGKDEVDPEGYSLPAQRASCIAKAQELDAEVVDEYVDRAESARVQDRPQFQAMLERIRERRDVDFVILDKINRFARNRRDDANALYELQRHGARLVSVKENIDDSPAGRLVHALMAGIAEYESANLGTEAIKGMTQKARIGGLPGRAPIGYLNVRKRIEDREVRTVAIDPDRAPFVKWVFESYATGDWTVKQVTDEVERRGLRSLASPRKPSVALSYSRVASMLNNPFYSGTIRFRGVEYPGRHEPLISLATWLKVQDVLAGRRHASERRREHDHYLKGTVFCDNCDSRFCLTLANGNGGAYLYFFCVGRAKGKACRQKYLQADALEQAVEDFYRRVQLEPERVEKLRQGLRDELAASRQNRERDLKLQSKRLESLSSQRQTLMEALYAKAIPMDMFRAEQARITGELSEAEAQQETLVLKFDALEASIERSLDLAKDLYAIYVAATPTERRKLNQAIFERLWVVDDQVVKAKLTDSFGALLADDMADHLEHQESEHQGAVAVFSGVGSNTDRLVVPTGFEPVSPP